MNMIEFNINHNVKVKLTDYGRSILKEQAFRDLYYMLTQVKDRLDKND